MGFAAFEGYGLRGLEGGGCPGEGWGPLRLALPSGLVATFRPRSSACTVRSRFAVCRSILGFLARSIRLEAPQNSVHYLPMPTPGAAGACGRQKSGAIRSRALSVKSLCVATAQYLSGIRAEW